MELSYDEIRRIHRLEKNSMKLVQVEQEFYNDLNAFLLAEKKTYLDSLKDFSSAKTRDFSRLYIYQGFGRWTASINASFKGRRIEVKVWARQNFRILCSFYTSSHDACAG